MGDNVTSFQRMFNCLVFEAGTGATVCSSSKCSQHLHRVFQGSESHVMVYAGTRNQRRGQNGSLERHCSVKNHRRKPITLNNLEMACNNRRRPRTTPQNRLPP
jgi:hypothetical protein